MTRRRFDAELEEEIAEHLSLLAERFTRQGMSAEQAWLAARRQFGGVTQVKNELRDRSRFRPWEAVAQDTVYMLRQFRKAPLFAIASILTLALGIGANTAIFTLVDQLILRLLPIRDPQKVMAVVSRGQFYGDNMGLNALSYPMYQALRDHNQVFSRTMCRRWVQFAANFPSGTEVLSGELVSGHYFPLLGVRAAAGRLFTAQDDLYQNANPVTVLSYDYWNTRFAGSRQVIGRKLIVNNYPLTVVGVAQPGFIGVEPGLPAQVFVPVMMTPALFPGLDFSHIYNERLRWINVYGRLKPDMTQERAKAGLQPLFHEILKAEMREAGFANATPRDRKQYSRMWLDVVPGGQGNSVLRHQYEKPLRMLMAITGFVLLIACANLAALLAARSTVRQKEIAVRLAMGSSRPRILQQLLTESVVLAVVGGAAGIGVAVLIVENLLRFLPENATGYAISSSPDLRILSFSLALSVLTGFAFGLIPALQAARPDIAETLKANAASVSGSAAQMKFRKLLVTGQIGLSLLLLIGASLFIRSLANLRAVNPGFSIENLVQFDVNLGLIGYSSDREHVFYGELERRLSHLPGVEAAGMATNPVLADSDWESTIRVSGHENKPGPNENAYINRVSPGYFGALGIHLLAGRLFRESDTVHSQKVVVVSESFAKHYFGNDEVIGQFVGRGFDPHAPKDMQIVGIVNDIDYQDLRQPHARQLYLCAPQGFIGYGTVYMRVKGNPRSFLASARELVHHMEPKAPVLNLKTVQHQLDESLVTERMVALLSSGFSVLAVLLAVVGLYGVMAYMVTQRAREIGIRMALGAVFGNVVWLVMREVVLLVMAGVLAAIPLALGLQHLVRNQLFGISSSDPLPIVWASVALSAIAMLAGFVPARRAAAADPVQVLRYE